MKKLNTPPGDDTLAFKGEMTLGYPFNPPLDPFTRGIRLIVAGAGGTRLDVTIPGGAYADPPRRGWTIAANGSSRYVDRSGAPLSGITGVVVQDKSARVPGLVRITVKGKGGSYTVSSTDLPLGVEVILDPPAAMSGECGDVRYTGPASFCTFTASGAALVCK